MLGGAVAWAAEELLPTEPKMITTALGRTTESRQIAILPFKPKKEGEERVMVGAFIALKPLYRKISPIYKPILVLAP